MAGQDKVLATLCTAFPLIGGARAGRQTSVYGAFGRLKVASATSPYDYMEHVALCLEAADQVQEELPEAAAAKEGEATKLDPLGFAEVQLALIYAWTIANPKDAAAWAFDQMTEWTAGEKPQLPITVRDLVLTVHGVRSAQTPLEQFIAQAGLRAVDLEQKRREQAAAKAA